MRLLARLKTGRRALLVHLTGRRSVGVRAGTLTSVEPYRNPSADPDVEYGDRLLREHPWGDWLDSRRQPARWLAGNVLLSPWCLLDAAFLGGGNPFRTRAHDQADGEARRYAGKGSHPSGSWIHVSKPCLR